jgi:hypothetical protein
MERIAHIFDIESLWSIDQMIWIVDKNNPSQPLLKMSESDFNLIKSGVFKSKNNLLRFNNKYFYIPDDLMEELKVISKKDDDLDLTDMAFSMREYFDKDCINDLKFEIKEDNFKHIKNKMDDIYVISTSIVKDKYSKMIKKLEEKLNNNGLEVDGYYLTAKTVNFTDEDEDVFTKGNILLKHLVGHSIKDYKFVDEECQEYDMINFYDIDPSSVKNLITTLQSQFEYLFHNSESSIQSKIKNVEDKKITFNIVNSNEINKFSKESLVLSKPKNIMKYESFRFKL